VATDNEVTNLGNNSIWKPPKQGKLKVNFDASFIQDTNQGFMGGIIRGHSAGVESLGATLAQIKMAS
jgi:hypothetical protein